MNTDTHANLAPMCGQSPQNADNVRTTTTPDYGEPWHKDLARGVRDRADDIICYPFGDPATEHKLSDRIAACVNACAGMADPATEIASLKAEIERFKANNRYQRGYHDGEKSKAIETEAMREKLWKAEEAFQKIIRSVPACVNGFWFWPSISPDGDYLGEIPTDPAFAMQEMQAIAETALAQLQNT